MTEKQNKAAQDMTASERVDPDDVMPDKVIPDKAVADKRIPDRDSGRSGQNGKRIAAVILMFVFFLGGRQLTQLVLDQRAAEAEAALMHSETEYPMSRDVFLLDTYCAVTVYEGGGSEALGAAVDALNEYDDLMNYSKESSDIYRINHRSSDTVEVSAAVAELLGICYEFCVLTDGVMEPAIRPVTSLWDFKDEKKVPETGEITAALEKVRSCQWRIEGCTFTAFDKNVSIDVGAVAKGFIADRIAEVLKENGVTSAVINLGGNVLCVGERPDGKAFSVAVRDPAGENSYAFELELKDGSAVTAGAYERCFEENSVRYHHIIDPETGYPARTGLESVTVTGPVSAVCDALSTSLFIMGEEEGKRFLDKYNAANSSSYEAYFLKEKG